MPKKGYKQTIEHKKLISKNLIGEKNGFYGKHHSQETKNKNRQWHFGKKQSKETIEKRVSKYRGKSTWIKGKKHTQDTKRKMREAIEKRRKRDGYINSPQARIKISIAKQNITKETRIKLSKAQRGNKGNNWQGGITPINKLIRHSLKYRLWRELVFKRDNWTCQECKIRGGKLHSHHIKSFSKYPKLRFDINNGKTLCIECHKKTDNYKK